MSDKVLLRMDGPVALVRLNRPEAYNSFDLETVSALADHLVALATDESVRGVVLAGEGKAFCAGGDLKWASAHEGGPPAGFHLLASRFHLAVLEIRRMAKPVLAAVHGAAAGGGFSLALACDFRVLGESAVLRQAYTSSGLCLDGGGTFTLPRLVGMARALEIAAFDRPISAGQALEWGLATKVVPDGTEVEAALELARELADKALHSLGWSKNLFNDSFDTGLETQMERERTGLGACAAHADGREGLAAFVGKRRPVFYKV